MLDSLFKLRLLAAAENVLVYDFGAAWQSKKITLFYVQTANC